MLDILNNFNLVCTKIQRRQTHIVFEILEFCQSIMRQIQLLQRLKAI